MSASRLEVATRHGALRARIAAQRADLTQHVAPLEAALGEPEGVKMAWRPTTMVEVGEDDAGKLMKLIDTLEEDDDVQTVWGNYDISDDVMERLG